MDHGCQQVGTLALGILAGSEILGPEQTADLPRIPAIAVPVFICLRLKGLWRLN